jgi:hypothetical protein
MTDSKRSRSSSNVLKSTDGSFEENFEYFEHKDVVVVVNIKSQFTISARDEP